MIYTDFKGLKLSKLGFGTMRLPTKGSASEIDEEQVFEMFDYAISKGVNYFDTAWGYHNKMSEIAVGNALKSHNREDFFLATKFPGYDVSNFGKIEEIFEKQLEKCQVDYFDFYLIHNVCEANIEYYLDPKYNTLPYLLEQKKNGRIKHLGFSTHADYDNFLRFMDMYGEHMEFCQIQLNYIDYEFQNAKAKVKYLNERNIPIWVMEPLRGGKLANIPIEKLSNLGNERPCPAAFRFLMSLKGVSVILSGMSDFEQVKDNINTFECENPLSNDELESILRLGQELTHSVPCTSCRYCTGYCPMSLDIPNLISLYNELIFTGGGFLAPMKVASMNENKRPTACISCRSCEGVCPQNIEISEIFKDFSTKLN